MTPTAHMQTAAQAYPGLNFLILASWARFPDRDLPESDPNAYVLLVNYASPCSVTNR
jgi:hypothetical protein